LPLSSISDFGHLLNNYKIKRSDIRKCKTADSLNKSPHRSNSDYFEHLIHGCIKKNRRSKIYDTYFDHQIEQDINQDYELPLSSIADFLRPIENKFNDTYFDHQIEQDINQDYELPLSSIADFLRPIENKFNNKELQKCGTVDYQTEQNNNEDDKFIKCEAVNFQSKENINHYNKSEPNRLICNKEQSTIIDDTSKKYECDICGKIFPKRTDIIKHFKTSMCYPEIIYTF